MQNHYSPKNLVQTTASVQAVSKQPEVAKSTSPTHAAHWEDRVFLPTYTRNGETRTAPNYACKIQFTGRRESFALHTADRKEAAKKARDIYLTIVRDGWDAAMRTYKPKIEKPPATITVGELFRLVLLTGLINAVTLTTYRTKLRTLIAFICGFGSGRAKGVRVLEWRQKVDQQPLSVITQDKVHEFKRQMLARGATGTPQMLHSAKVTIDGYIRNLRSLFRQEVVDELARLGACIPPMPFDQVPMSVRGRSAFRYVSTIQPQALMKAAAEDLAANHVEAFKIFILAILLGFRRNEIDKLRWDMINWERGHIALVQHEFLHLKSTTSSDEVKLTPELIELLKCYHKASKSEYVVHSQNMPRAQVTYRHYRCDKYFSFLCEWLRDHGVIAQKPIQTLRKECGSLINERFGILAAKNVLRQANIEVTVTYYASEKRKLDTGLDALLPRMDAM